MAMWTGFIWLSIGVTGIFPVNIIMNLKIQKKTKCLLPYPEGLSRVD